MFWFSSHVLYYCYSFGDKNKWSLDILIDSKHTAKIQMYDREVAKIKVLSETGYIYERRKTHFKRGSLIIHIDQTSRHQHHFVDCAVHKNKQHTYKSTTVK